MFNIVYNYKGEWIHNDVLDYIPPFFEGMTIDIHNIHYMISRIIYQPENRRYKIFLEQ